MKGESIARVRKQAAIAGANRLREYKDERSLRELKVHLKISDAAPKIQNAWLEQMAKQKADWWARFGA